VPGPDDDVIIDVTNPITVTYSGPPTTIRSLRSQESLILTSGTLTIRTSSTIAGGLTINNSQLTVNGDLDVSGLLSWNGGTMDGPGTTHARGGLAITNGRPNLHGRTLANYARATVSQALLVGIYGAIFENRAGAMLDIQGDLELTAGSFRNDGIMRKSAGAGTAAIIGQLTNTGTIEVQSGRLRLDIRGASTSAGSITALPGTALDFLISGSLAVSAGGRVTAPRVSVNGNGQLEILGAYDVAEASTILNGTTRFGPGATITNLGKDVTITYGKLDISTGAPVHVTNLYLTGGELTGTDNLTVDEWLKWTGSAMSGTGRTIIEQELEISGPGWKQSAGRTVENHGTTTWLGGWPRFYEGAVFDNRPGGRFEIQVDDTFVGTFVNAGTLRKSAGAGTTQIQGRLTNSGWVDLRTGTLFVFDFEASTNSGAFTGEPGTTLEWRTSGNLTTRFTAESRIAVPQVIFSQGKQTVEGSYTVDRTLIKQSQVNFSTGNAVTLPNLRMESGELTGTSDVIVTGALDWIAGTMTGSGKTIVQGRMTIGVPGLLSNSGVRLERMLENRSTIIWYSGYIWFTSNGTLINTVGALFEAQAHARLMADSFGVGLFRNEGTVRKTGGSSTSEVWVAFAGSGTEDVQGGTLDLLGTNANTMRFTGAPSGMLELRGNGPSAPTILAAGSRVETPNVKLSGHTVLVRGTYNVTGTTTIEGLATFDTGAQLRNLGATTTITNGGDVTFNTGAPVQMRDLVMNPVGNLRATGDITVEGRLTWRGGAMYGPGRTTIRGGMALGSSMNYSKNPYYYAQGLIGRTLVNESTATCDRCLIYADEGAVLQNTASGTFRVTRNAAFARCTAVGVAELGQVWYECRQNGTAPVFRNEGTLIIAGLGSLYFTAVPGVWEPQPYPAQLVNSGTIQVEGGGLNAIGGYTQTGGGLELRGGSIAGSTLDIQGGSLSGTGTITGTVVNGGSVQPGGSDAAGVLAIVGTYRQTATGRLAIEVAGLLAGVQFDRLSVSGRTTLEGILAVKGINGFVPASGDSFAVLTYGSRSGAFASVNGGDTNYTIDYGAQDAKLSVP
jgi:hypothetical protein